MMNGSRLPKPPRRPSHLSPFVDSMEGQVWCFKSPAKKNAPKTHMFDTNKKTLTALFWVGNLSISNLLVYPLVIKHGLLEKTHLGLSENRIYSQL